MEAWVVARWIENLTVPRTWWRADLSEKFARTGAFLWDDLEFVLGRGKLWVMYIKLFGLVSIHWFSSRGFPRISDWLLRMGMSLTLARKAAIVHGTRGSTFAALAR